MNLTRFIENRFQELRLQESQIEIKDPEQFPVVINSNIKAHHWVLSKYRHLLTCLLVPNVLFSFLMMKMGLRKKPTPVLLDLARKQKAAEAENKARAEISAGNISKLQPIETQATPSPA